MMFITTLATLFLISLEEPVSYGDLYFEDTKDREAPLVHFKVGYSQDISNSFLDLHSIVADAQVRVWRYFSTGALFQWTHSQYSQSGRAFRDLSAVGLVVKVPTQQWALFSHTTVDFMIGQWNVLNMFPLRVDLIVGGGAGAIRSLDDVNGASSWKISYLWSAEQRMMFYKNAGLYVQILGHRAGTHLGAGLHANFD